MLRDRRIRIALYVTLAALIVLTASAWAYDNSREDRIAKGVKVGGVDIGGLQRTAAERRLSEQLAGQIERPVRVKVAGKRLRLTAKRARLGVDVQDMVQAAIDRGRSGGLVTRVWRGLTGGEVATDLEPQVYYSRLAVRRFVKRVVAAVDRPARDAEVKFRLASLPAVPSQTGLRVRRAKLRADVEDALARLGAARTVRGEVKVVKPKVTTKQLAKKYPYVITVDRPDFKLRFFKRLGLSKTYKIAVGQAGLETPAGLYHIQDKAVNPSWHVPNSDWAGKLAGKVIPPGPDNPIKARWMGIYAGAGIHGTADIGSLGTAASHGCIRMAIPDVEQLYDKVPLQTPVFIQ
jgi:lipoprotein-anchoring transpeptidase ErfK/SrfK